MSPASCIESLTEILTPFFFSALDSSAALWYLRETETTLTSGDARLKQTFLRIVSFLLSKTLQGVQEKGNVQAD